MRPIETSRDRILELSTDQDLRRRFMVFPEPETRANLRIGLLLEVLDKLAEETALDYVQRSNPRARVVTAAIDDIVLRTPADVHHDLELHARINRVGRSSLEVGIRVEHPAPDPIHVASCYFTMVAREGRGDSARSLVVDPLDYESAEEIRRAEKAEERRQAYRSSRAALEDPPTREEYDHLAQLHRAQEQPGFAGDLLTDLVSTTWERMYPEQENVPEKIFGGYLIRRAFELTAIQAEEIAPDRPVIVRVDRINFLQPVRVSDKLRFVSRIVYTGRTSFAIEVSIERISRDRETKALSNDCVFTFVNVSPEMEPLAVRPVFPTTYADDTRYLAAYRRHRLQSGPRRNSAEDSN